MKRLIFSLITLLLCICSLIKAQDATQNADALLWEISGNGLSQPSYLFGTIHLMCPDDIQITKEMKDALRNSQQLVLELDFDDPGVMSGIQQAATMADGTTLNELLSEEEYQLVSGYLQDSLNIPIQAVNTMKPLMLSTLTFLDVLDCQPGSYENTLTEQARMQDKEVVGLETVEEQIKAFDFIPLAEQSDYLVESIQQYDATVAEITSMLEAYRKGQITELYNLSHKAMKEMKGAEKSLLIDRNQKWVPAMATLAKEQATFFAVGAGHLGGPQGVIALLRDQGYIVEAVMGVMN